MRVAQVREPPGTGFVEVAFLESARFYRLPKSHPSFAEALAVLRSAQASGGEVEVTTVSIDSDLIAAVVARAG